MSTRTAFEGAFGLFKRAIVAAYHQISIKHVDRYLDESEYRYSNRKNAYLFRDVLLRLMDAKGDALDRSDVLRKSPLRRLAVLSKHKT